MNQNADRSAYERSMPSDNRGYVQSLTPAQIRAGVQASTLPQNNIGSGVSNYSVSHGSNVNYRNYAGNNSQSSYKPLGASN